MRVEARIRAKLSEALQPERLTVIDESARHAGHAGQARGKMHFRVEIVSAAFEGAGQLARQRRVYEILKDELKGGVHALSLSTLTPGEVKEPHGPV